MNRRNPIPDWVPIGVRAMHDVAEMDNEVAWRLLTDPRLEKAWIDLRELPAPVDLKQRIQRIDPCFCPDRYGKACPVLSDFDRQAAALFYEIVNEMHQRQRTYWSAADAQRLSKPYLDAAKQCEIAPNEDELLQWHPEIIDALKVAGKYLRQQGEMRAMANNPRVVGHDINKNSNEKRGHCQFIAMKIIDLFAPPAKPAKKFPNAPIARFLAVSLELDDDIEALRDNVYDWIKRLRSATLA